MNMISVIQLFPSCREKAENRALSTQTHCFILYNSAGHSHCSSFSVGASDNGLPSRRTERHLKTQERAMLLCTVIFFREKQLLAQSLPTVLECILSLCLSLGRDGKMCNTTKRITMKTMNTVNQCNFQIDLCSSKKILFGQQSPNVDQTAEYSTITLNTPVAQRFWQQITHTLSILACDNPPRACNLSACQFLTVSIFSLLRGEGLNTTLFLSKGWLSKMLET